MEVTAGKSDWEQLIGRAEWSSKPPDLGWGLWGEDALLHLLLSINPYLCPSPRPVMDQQIPNPTEPITAQRRNKAPHFLTSCCTLVLRHSRVPGFPFFTDFHIYYLRCTTGGESVLQLEISMDLELPVLLLLRWSVGTSCCWIIIFHLFKVVLFFF